MDMKKPEEIKTHPTFESLFPINPAVLAKIEQDMRDGTLRLFPNPSFWPPGRAKRNLSA